VTAEVLARASAAVGPGISVTGVGVRLGRTPVLIDATFSIGGGEWLGLIGPNGSGKTTLLRAVVGLVDHTGVIRIGDGEDQRDRARMLAYLPQLPTLPPGMTVAEYVLLGRTAHLGWLGRESAADRDAAAEAIDRLELGRFAARDVSALSGGEVQRVTLARAIATGCPVLVLDEPTSALDIGHQTAVLELVEELRHDRGLTVIAAMHDLTAAGRYADRLLLLSCGSTVAFGPPAEVLTEALLAEFYQTSVSVLTAPDGSLVVVPLRESRSPS
jgi:iron complex transport system ATP-binding protein